MASGFMHFRPFHGPVSFKFKDPDTGHEFKAHTRQALFAQILAYRAQNELPLFDGLNTVIDNYLCSLPENAGSCEPLEKLPRGFMSYLKGGMALIKNMLYSKYVSQEEADRRAQICISCPQNIFPDKGPFVRWSDEIMEHSVGDRRALNYQQLGNCGACDCPLRAKVWYGDTIELTEEELSKTPDFCWQREVLRPKPR